MSALARGVLKKHHFAEESINILMAEETQQRKEKLKQYIKQNPYSSTLEQEQLAEIEKEEREEGTKSEVLY